MATLRGAVIWRWEFAVTDGRSSLKRLTWALAPVLLIASVTEAAWLVTELPTCGGPGSVEAWAINSSDVVCGHGSDAAGGQSAFRYDGTLTLLPHLDATAAHSVARDINSCGVIVGFSENANGRERAVFWSGTTITELPAPAGVNPDRSMRAEAINDAGVIVGFYTDDDWHAKPYYYDGTIHDLAPVLAAAGFPGRGYAKDINNSGLIIGHAQAGIYRVWTYDTVSQTVTVLGTLNPLYSSTVGAVNDAGKVACRGADSSGSYRALLHDGTFRILDATVTDAQWSNGIDSWGRVVGTAGSGSNKWSWYSDGPGDGSMVAIDPTGWTEVRGEGLNDRGRIVGYGQTPSSGGESRAFVVVLAGDSDGDGDVDLGDFGRFQTCFTVAPPPAPGCDTLDFDGDGDVDLDDFVVFEDSLGGPRTGT
jgi:probable HAF family extracellular repeat protein